MRSIKYDNRTLRVRLSRKVVRDFVENNILPDSNGVIEYGNASNASISPDKNVHDSKIRDSNGKQPAIMLDRLRHRRAPATTASAVADNVTSARPSKTSRQQKTPEIVSNGQSTGDVPHAKSTRSKTSPVSMKSTRSRRIK